MPLTIAIDGPVGAGKSTISDAVAAKLGILHLDTGAMYRAVGLYALENGMNPRDEEAVCKACLENKVHVDVRYENGAQQSAGFDAMTADFFQTFAARYPGRVYRGDWNRDIWYNVKTVAHWYGMGDCPKIWAHYAAWNPETYVPIPRDTDSNEINGTGLTASIRAMHYGNDAFRKVVAPAIADAMARRIG